jgi:hypothetical protein
MSNSVHIYIRGILSVAIDVTRFCEEFLGKTLYIVTKRARTNSSRSNRSVTGSREARLSSGSLSSETKSPAVSKKHLTAPVQRNGSTSPISRSGPRSEDKVSML